GVLGGALLLAVGGHDGDAVSDLELAVHDPVGVAAHALDRQIAVVRDGHLAAEHALIEGERVGGAAVEHDVRSLLESHDDLFLRRRRRSPRSRRSWHACAISGRGHFSAGNTISPARTLTPRVSVSSHRPAARRWT